MMMDARRWQSPAATAAAAEAAAEGEEEAAGGCGGGGGAGGPSRRPPRRGLHRASPYGLGPRRWFPKDPVASRILLPAPAQNHAASDNNQMDQRELLRVTHEMQSHSIEVNTNSTALDNKAKLLQEGDCRNQNDGSGLAEIENIIKQNHFSRDETERLIEIMRSRTPDLCNEDHRVPRFSTKGFETTPFLDKWSTPAKQIDVRLPCGTDIFVPSNVLNVAASPIELARAYMEAQNSASVQESQKRKFRALSHGVEMDNSSSKIFPKVATDTPVCWPGSVVRNYPNYLTPQSNKGRTLPPTSSRTTYTGSVFPRSNKYTRTHQAYNNSSGKPQFTTPLPGGSKVPFEDKIALTGGALGVQSSIYSKGACGDTSGAATPFTKESSAAKKNIGSNLQGPPGKGTIESGSTLGCVPMVDNISHSKSASLSVHPKSSKTAHKILQHLERTIPSPTAKPLELRQTSAKRTTSSVVTSVQHKEPDSVITNSHRQSSIIESGSAQQEISDAPKVLAPPSSSNAEQSTPKIQNSGSNSEITEMPSSQHTSKSDSTSTPAAEVLDKSTGNGFTFTFPVPKSSISLPEPPPTPSLSLPPSIPSADSADIPKFTFGSSSTTDKLVFSFDLASSSRSAEEAAPTFKFGSDKKRELSFDVAGKDAVCF